MRFLFGTLCGVVACVLVFQAKEGHSEEHGKAIVAAYKQGRVDALKTNPVSFDLEETCVSLWAGRTLVEEK